MAIIEMLSETNGSMYEQEKRAHIRKTERRLQERQGGGDIFPEALGYNSLRLYDVLAESIDPYILISNMRTGVFCYSPSMVGEPGFPQSIVGNVVAV